MIRQLTRLARPWFVAAVAVSQPLAGQGIGASAAVGLFGSLTPSDRESSLGTGAELTGHWGFRSGFAAGLGARAIRFARGDGQLVLFLDGRYAPPPSAARRTRPVVAVRAGPFIGGGQGDGDGSPLLGIEAATAAGIAIRAAPGISFSVLGDLTVVLAGTAPRGAARRLHPGLLVGVTFH